MKRIMLLATVVLVMAAVMVASALPAFAQNAESRTTSQGRACTVQANAPNSSYPTIQSAVKDSHCASVLVAPGTYQENIIIDRDVTVIGVGGDKRTVVDGSLLPGEGYSLPQHHTVFTIGLGNKVALQGLTITKGGVPRRTGGGISNNGTLTLKDSTVSDNKVSSISNGGTLTLNNSPVSGNSACIQNQGTLTLNGSPVSGNGGFPAGVGGICNAGTLTLNNSPVSDNSGIWLSGGGVGGISNGGNLTLNNSPVSGNNGGTVGGISNEGTLTLKDSPVSGNTANNPFWYEGSGGGISNHGTLTIYNSPVSGNKGLSYGSWGGIGNYGTLTINESTVSDNEGGALSGPPESTSAVGGVYNASTLTLNGSTVSDNRGRLFGGVRNDDTLKLCNNSAVENNFRLAPGSTAYTEPDDISGPGSVDRECQ